MTAAPMPPKIQPMSQQVSQTEFSKIHSPNNTNDEQAQYLNDSSNTMLNMTSEHIYASGSPGVEKDTHNTSMPVIQYGKGPLPPPPLPQSMKPSWPGIQHHNTNIKAQIPNSFSPNTNGNIRANNEEEALPNDSLYGGGHHQGQQQDVNQTKKSGKKD